ncbi:hypothetical protein IFR08_05605 [Pseudomonas fluorescens]|uniref:Uncharacterized protein n=1 Tax=Pseudomonas fluorescens TaxID=294 RepID=A0A2N1E572_PSEFL|nr:DUF6021 family protein [Pseudomonas fluorescens]MBD8097274.1 hypothetical protein [Pseudomonas fluorescens]MBD8773248.1 hypothetical protein [Pseudomonas fluorescens]MBD8777580.1 hypothetical protein [Pseudomonas fluorescens]MBD8794182.1 hypothetical protein [Pseudomonas fluorescens]PKH19885.1 hypothetical protein CIB54_14160 [Pseudomonas fluorescens]
MSNPPNGPRSDEHATGKDELGFDPDSPEASDPQVDPIGPAIAPLDKQKQPEKKPPYDPLGDLKK